MEVKDNRRISAAQIEKPASSKAGPVNSYIDASVRVPYKRKERNVVLPTYNQ